MHRNITLVLSALVVVAWAVSGPLPGASADPLCYSASTTGLVPKSVGPVCEPYPHSVTCTTEGTGLAPVFGVEVSFCVPQLTER